MFLLPHSEDRMILSSFIWIGYQRVTGRQTDRLTDRRTELPWLIEHFALQAMRLHCKNDTNSAEIIIKSEHNKSFTKFNQDTGYVNARMKLQSRVIASSPIDNCSYACNRSWYKVYGTLKCTN